MKWTYEDTILLTDPAGQPLTGLDATTTLNFSGFPDLPAAKYTGNGFQADSGKSSTIRVVMDAEGLVLDEEGGGFWISDEYGPFLFHFDSTGKMDQAIRPPDAVIPRRNGDDRYVCVCVCV